MSSEHPTPKPTLGADDPVGWYECRPIGDEPDWRLVRFFDGHSMRESTGPDTWHRDPKHYTDFIGPLTAQPAGVAELREACREMKGHLEVIAAYKPQRCGDMMLHTVQFGQDGIQALLAKVNAALAATEPGTRDGEGK